MACRLVRALHNERCMDTLTTTKQVAVDEVDARAQFLSLTEEVARLERAWHRGELPELLERSNDGDAPRARVHEQYRLLSHHPVRSYRRLAVSQLLQRTQFALQAPARAFEARALFRASCVPDPVGPWRLEGAEVKGASLTLRRGQLRSQRDWGLGLRFADPMARRLYATTLLRGAIHDLVCGLHALLEIDRQVTGNFHGRLSSGLGWRFERLVLDLLNREHTRAREASLCDDLLQKTDLFLEFAAGHEARVQVSCLADRARHDRKLALIPAREELVIVTPRTLAGALMGGRGCHLVSRDERAVLLANWRCLDGLAAALHRQFCEALEQARAHPLGPAAALPGPLAHLLIRFVEHEAPFAWQARRAREVAEAPRPPHPSRLRAA